MTIPAYAYSRVSLDIQTEGTGLDRQRSMALDWLIKNPNYHLEESLVDDGRSAYKGHNLSYGALGEFIQRCERGEIPENSLLLVEAIDRISRRSVDEQRELWRKLKELKINIAVAKFGDKVFRWNDQFELGYDIQLTVMMDLAHQESKQKAERIRAAHARNFGVTKSKMCPYWLRLNDDRSEYVIIEDKAKVVRKIFQMKLDGMGADSIVRALRKEGIKTSSGRWFNVGTVRKYLKNERVMGWLRKSSTVYTDDGRTERQPTNQVIKDYYPAIISEEEFNAVQMSFKKMTSGKRSKIANPLRGLMRCPKCERPMTLTNKWLRCRGRASFKDCDHTYLVAEPIFDAFNMYMRKIIAVGMKGGGVNLRDIDAKKHEIEQLESERKNIIGSLRYLPDEASRQDAGLEIEVVNNKIAGCNLELQKLQNQKVGDEVDLDFDVNSEAGKFKVNAILSSVLSKVVLDDLDCHIYFKNGNEIGISYVLMKGLVDIEI
ncbi:recombinase family protein [Vibrio vulnificus]|uniref:recombinase family protein n=1 Tax=Vibrio vulnificus TaxID=672 RepID=UPI0024DFDE3F|nr:recombinase family protein [Vibrio vulnificus]MDK2606112.1 recombinase family protein [Vibrio vulnificus]MDK2609856.1 recombinase family protein [Vibrio vulnificus]MDK2627354.1 recombinase family protein [Vibrio vulnificus]MDK2702799.1 recombinase family protein [Vibrio vulnificus]